MKKIIALASATFFLTACSITPFRVALNKQTIQDAKATHTASVVAQPEVGIEIPISDSSASTAQFGLLGALVGGIIDAQINKSSAETGDGRVKPVRNALLGFDFDKQLETSLRQQNVFDLTPEVSLKTYKASPWPGDILKENGDVVAVTDTRYQFSFDMQSFSVTTTVNVFPKKAFEGLGRKRWPEQAPLYRNRFVYLSKPAPRMTKTPEEIEEASSVARRYAEQRLEKGENKKDVQKSLDADLARAKKPYHADELPGRYANYWAMDNGAFLRKELVAAIDIIAGLIKEDIQDPTPILPVPKGAPVVTELRKEEGRVVVRDMVSGVITSKPNA